MGLCDGCNGGYHTVICLSCWLLLFSVSTVSRSLGQFITHRQPFVSEVVSRTGTGRGPLLQFQESNWQQEDVSATGLGWLWLSGGYISGPALIYNTVSLWTPFSQSCFFHKQQHWRTSGMWFTPFLRGIWLDKQRSITTEKQSQVLLSYTSR